MAILLVQEGNTNPCKRSEAGRKSLTVNGGVPEWRNI